MHNTKLDRQLAKRLQSAYHLSQLPTTLGNYRELVNEQFNTDFAGEKPLEAT